MSHPHADQVKAFLLDLQDRICAGLEGAGMPDFSTVDLSDIFEDFFGFGMGSRGGRARNAPRRLYQGPYTA